MRLKLIYNFLEKSSGKEQGPGFRSFLFISAKKEGLPTNYTYGEGICSCNFNVGSPKKIF
jgi:hypothetical protein